MSSHHKKQRRPKVNKTRDHRWYECVDVKAQSGTSKCDAFQVSTILRMKRDCQRRQASHIHKTQIYMEIHHIRKRAAVRLKKLHQGGFSMLMEIFVEDFATFLIQRSQLERPEAKSIE